MHATDPNAVTVEQMVQAMLDEDSMTEEEIEATFTDVEPSATTIYFTSISDSGELSDIALDEFAPERDDDGTGVDGSD